MVQPLGNLLDFSGRTLVITGGSSGIGAATSTLALACGATVHQLDITPPADGEQAGLVHHLCDLGDPASIDGAAAALPPTIDGLLNCAGVPNGGRFTAEDVLRVNWLGLRHLTEALLPRLTSDAAVVHIASTAGRDWPARRELHADLMAASGFDAGLATLRANADAWGDGYALSKEAVQYYTLWRSVQLLPTGIRMNSVCPGVTDTAIIADFRRGLGDEIIDHAAAVAGRMADPTEMAPAMLFLADHRSSSYVNGVNLNIDRGTGAARATNQSDPTTIWGS
jgi:NAD(P)-dependent dehydrogenase (short-subunit alcohol dehydrogenase family)